MSDQLPGKQTAIRAYAVTKLGRAAVTAYNHADKKGVTHHPKARIFA
jgi:hypothetical protein